MIKNIYTGIHVKYLFSDLNKIWIFPIDFREKKELEYNI